MINLRYHIVSLTAVFLALAIGVLLGGTYLDKYTVDQLDQSITNAEERIRETRAENDRLRGEVGDAQARNQALIGSGTNTLFADNLSDVPVLLVAAEGADETSRRNLVQVLNTAGAEFRGTLTVTGRIDLDDARVANLGGQLALDDPPRAEVLAELIDQFGAALAAAGTAVDAGSDIPGGTTAPPTTAPGQTAPGQTAPTQTAPTQTTPGDTATTLPGPVGGPVPPTTQPEVEPPDQPEIVTLMLEAGLLSFEAPAEAPTSGPLLSATGYRFVFVSGVGAAVPDTTFLLPTLRRMAAEGPVPVVLASAASGDDDRDAVVAGVRDDAELSRLVSTVDNLEWFNGLVSTVLGLEEIGRGARGHYGEGRGAAAPIPTGT
ncbi:MAG TPA: copper transporter [Acidimicrobiales bacterium]|nr:copper transporter [Acidimicrobiales bacterium]